VNKKLLHEKLEFEASCGATLSELDAVIDDSSQLQTDVERGEAWLYAWALVKGHERRLLAAARKGEQL
jgi:hypothetical protein